MSDTINSDSLVSGALSVGTNYALEVGTPIADSPQTVSDSQGNPSALAIGKGFLGVNTTTADWGTVVAAVEAPIARGPMLSLINPGQPTNGDAGEASIRFSNLPSQRWWHVGMAGGAGAGNFFIWGDTVSQVLNIAPNGAVTFMQNMPVTIESSLTVNGALTASGGLNVSSLNVSALHGIPAASTAPAGTQLVTLAIDPATGNLYALGPQVP